MWCQTIEGNMMHLLKRVSCNYVYLSRKATRIYCQPKKQMQTDRSRVISFFFKEKADTYKYTHEEKGQKKGPRSSSRVQGRVRISCKDFIPSSWSSVLYPSSISEETHQAFLTPGLCTGSPLIDSKDSALSKYRGWRIRYRKQGRDFSVQARSHSTTQRWESGHPSRKRCFWDQKWWVLSISLERRLKLESAEYCLSHSSP